MKIGYLRDTFLREKSAALNHLEKRAELPGREEAMERAEQRTAHPLFLAEGHWGVWRRERVAKETEGGGELWEGGGALRGG